MGKYILVLFSCFVTAVYSQPRQAVTGRVFDNSLHNPLPNATVCFVSERDSILQAFAYSDKAGYFLVPKLLPDKYIVIVSLSNYADYVEHLTLDASPSPHDLGEIGLNLKTKLLQEVLVKGKVRAIRINGDTTEFNAKAYVIQPNDKVEDLLRQLPGIQVDKDGRISANGRAVNKVLVDGEEFFGDDPTLVTQNIRSDMVSKVQLYDKKSDQATFTGIDDGVKTKTINIVLKPDKKNGEFGKANIGIGSDGYYDEQAIYNRFKNREKYSAYITVANDGKLGLRFNDSNNLGTAGNVSIADDGLITISGENSGLDSFNGNYDNRGIPKVVSGGIHYDGKWNGDNESINANYKIGSIDVTGVTTSTIVQRLPQATLSSNSSQKFDNYAFRQKLDATYQLKLDPSSSFKLAVDGTSKTFKVRNSTVGAETNEGDAVNQQVRDIDNSGSQQIENVFALYTKKLKKKRRTLSWSVNQSYNTKSAQGYLNSRTKFFGTAGGGDSTQTVDQYKTSRLSVLSLKSDVVYTEPISARVSLIVNYAFIIDNASAVIQSFDQGGAGYTLFNPGYSNSYRFNQAGNQIGGILNYNDSKLTINLGSKTSWVDFRQIDEFSNTSLSRGFVNWNPLANVQYKFSHDNVLSINYTGNPNQPSIEEIQPVAVNTDPLYVVVGNPKIKPSFTHSLSAAFSSANESAETSLQLFGSYALTTSGMVDEVSTDAATGKSVVTYTNLSSSKPFNYYLNANFSKKVAALDGSLQFGLNTYGNVSYGIVNDELSKSRYGFSSATAGFNKYVQDKYSLNFSFGPTYTTNEIETGNVLNNALGYLGNLSSTLYLPGKTQFSPSIRYSYVSKTSAFQSQRRTIVNAAISKAFLKDRKLKVTLSVNDLLNQNNNFSRTISGNTASEVNTTAIRRYLMLALSWDFTKFRSIATKN